MEKVDWKNVIINVVAMICCTIVGGLMVSGCNGCLQREHDYRIKALEQRSR